MATKLTDELVRELAPPGRGNRITYDEVTRGLGVRVTAAGARAYVFNYRVRATGQERRITLGDAVRGDGRTVMTVKAARARADALRQSVKDGRDPMGELHAAREAPTVTDLATRYFEFVETRKRPKSLKEDKAMLDGVILPALGARKLAALTRADVVKLLADLSKRAPVRANRVHSLLRRMLNLAITEFEMCEGPNPAIAIERNPEERRTRYMEPAELARLLTAIGAHRNQQSANVMRLALLTGARRGELLGAQWSQFNLEAGTWTRPSSMTKQKREHTVVLNGPARELLTDMRAASETEYLFPGRGAAAMQGDLKRSWTSVCRSAGITGLRFHDLRHSFASFLVSSGHNLPLIGQMLGHSSPVTTQRYAHLLLDPQREAAERVGTIVTGAAKRGDDVVPLIARRRV
jgi:integrase